MKKLNLPVNGDFPENDRWLSMDEYVEFVNFNRTIWKRRTTKKDERDMRVNVPFVIK
jgi:hypothetical protein